MKRACWLCILGIGLYCFALTQAQTSHRFGENIPKTDTSLSAEYATLYEEGQRLYQAGYLDDARLKLETVVSKYPHHQASVRLLTAIEQTLKYSASTQVRKTLENTILPRVVFKDATAGSVIEFLRDETRRIDPAKKGVNFVVDLPEEIRAKTITLDLVDIPVVDVLKYTSESAGFRYRFDHSAVVISMGPNYTPSPRPSATRTSP